MKSVKVEWRHLIMHPKLLVVMLVAACIPMMYAGFFLGSVWDPYNNTHKLPVAVVNNDTGATLHGKKIQVGDTVVASLRRSNLLQWQFVTDEVAQKGIQNGQYYMRIIIPKEFSARAASFAQQDPQQATIQYETTPSKNYVGSMISRQAAENIEIEAKKALTNAYAAALLHMLEVAVKGIDDAAHGADALRQGGIVLQGGAQQLQNGVQAYARAIWLAHDSMGRLQQGLGQLQAGAHTLTKGAERLEYALPSASRLQQLREGVAQYGEGIRALDTQLNDPRAHKQLTAAMEKATRLRDTVRAIDRAIAELDNFSTETLMTALHEKIAATTLSEDDKAELQAMVAQVSRRVDMVTEKLPLLRTLRPQLATTLQEITAAISALQQAQRVQQSVATLATSYTTLQAGTMQLIQGYDTLQPVAAQITNGSRVLFGVSTQAVTGAGQLQQGAKSLAMQTQTLLRGAERLYSGTGQLQEGNVRLSNRLREGASRLAIQPVGDSVARHIASPVTIKESEVGTVKNYGHALAPYVQSLALYIGAIVFNLLYPVRKVFTRPRSGFSWWLSKASVAAAISLLQATVIGLLSMWILGLQPESLWQYLLMLQVTSLAYMAIVMFLSIVLDNIGRFLSLLLLVVQLGGSAGTFPIELSGRFFQAVHPYLPMSHSVMGLREAISGGMGDAVYWGNIAWLIGVIIAFSALLIISLALRKKRVFRHDVVTE